MRHADRPDNEGRAFLLKITMRYGRKIVGAVLGKTSEIAADGGVGIHVWNKGEETGEVVFITLAEVLWCDIDWLG
jgi:hypothetical protein